MDQQWPLRAETWEDVQQPQAVLPVREGTAVAALPCEHCGWPRGWQDTQISGYTAQNLVLGGRRALRMLTAKDSSFRGRAVLAVSCRCHPLPYMHRFS